MLRTALLGLAACLSIAASGPARAAEATVAVASNMLPAARAMADAFAAASGHSLTLASGSTGKLAAQIENGAPFDVFLAADVARPAALVEAGLATERRGYAIGRLVLVGPAGSDLDRPMGELLAGRRVAIADPALAPYGAAATDVMARARIDPEDVTLLTGENIGQVATYLATGNAEYGFVALSLLPGIERARPVVARILPAGWHRAIVQDAVLLRRGSTNAAAGAFWTWLFGPEAADILTASGYSQPDP